ncbi:MAG: hypothetical protein IKI54_01450 [Lachnospiraceae bacterium]|nr:hypothetical protein [Lachnospiraceae bacterium]
MTIPMALVDYIPVVLFLITAVVLQRDLYNKMSKGAFALFCAGTIMVFIAGFFKATWKLLYAASICDFEKLNHAFFPMQASGFLLAALGLIAMYFFRQKKGKETLFAAAPAVYSGTMIFVAMMSLGVLGICTILALLAKKMKQYGAMVVFILAFAGMMGMGYLSSKDFADPAMNWIGEGVNILAQCLLFFGTWILHRTGLRELKLNRR